MNVKKSLVAVVSVLTIGSFVFPVTFESTAAPVYATIPNLYGSGYMTVPDPNGDGVLSIADATLVAMYVEGGVGDPTEDQLIQFDVTQNGIISTADVHFIMFVDAMGALGGR